MKRNNYSVSGVQKLTFELIEDTNGFNDIPRVGKNLNDVVLHGAHHTESRLMTCSGDKRKKLNEKHDSGKKASHRCC